MDARPPPPFDFEADNLVNEWTQWLELFELYLVASKRNKDSDGEKVAFLLNQLGQRGLEIYKTLVSDYEAKTSGLDSAIASLFADSSTAKADEKKLPKFGTVVSWFTQYFAPKKNILHERYKFYRLKRKDGQPYVEFVTNLKTAASSCEFPERDNMVRDRLIEQISEDSLLNRLLDCGGDLTLEKAVNMVKQHDQRIAEMKDFRQPSVSTDAVQMMAKNSYRSKYPVRSDPRHDYIKRSNPNSLPVHKFDNSFKSEEYQCKKCGYVHTVGNCLAFGKQCSLCKEMNHFAIGCAKRHQLNRTPSKKFTRLVETENSEEDQNNSSLFVDQIKKVQIVNNQDGVPAWSIFGKIGSVNIKFKIDTGSDVNILPLRVFRILQQDGCTKKIEPITFKLNAYNNVILQVEGSVTLLTSFSHASDNIEFVIINTADKPILGLEALSKLNIIKRINSIQEHKHNFGSKEDIHRLYEPVFTGLGKFPGKPYKIILKPDCNPVCYAPRRVPHHVRDKLGAHLNLLVKMGVIQKAEGPSEWCHPLVIVEKPNGSLRLCLDPKDLNSQIVEDKYQIPTQDEVLSDLHGKEYFSILDLKDSFHQIPLDKESSKICTFGTPFGKYVFKRLGFGIKTAAEVFQRWNTDVFGKIKGLKIYIDDLIISGASKEEHDSVLSEVLNVAQKAGITFNFDKFQFRQKRIKILGHIVTKDGVQIDPNRTIAITNMPEPKDKKSLMSFLGMVKYLAKFLPNLSELSTPLRELTKDDTPWVWTSEHSNCMRTLKSLITNSPVLAHYNDHEPLIIQSDASNNGIGCVLMQNGKPLAFASRVLTKSERNFAMIEKEMLAITYALEHFHYYTYGKEVFVQTDHKPLVSIAKRNFNKVPSRLQKLSLRLAKYKVTVNYLPGRLMLLADTLSRAFLETPVKEDPELDVVVHTIVKNLMSEKSQAEFSSEIREDSILSCVLKYVKKGWPQKVPTDLLPYFQIRHQLTLLNGLLLNNDKIIVPPKMKNKILKLLHEGHLGINKTVSKARLHFYWPKMSSDVEQYILSCNVCQSVRQKNPKQEMIPVERPTRPWVKLGMDIMEYKQKIFLVTIDYYSRWLEMLEISNKSIPSVIKVCNTMFSCHGYPGEIITDNNPFSSRAFKEYLHSIGSKLTTSSPHYPKGHGLAEAGVKLAKNILRKASEANLDYLKLLLEYRNTCLTDLGFSPAQLLFNRSLKDKITWNETILSCEVPDPKLVTDRRALMQAKQKAYHDINSKALPVVGSGDNIRFRHNNTWDKGTILHTASTPRSFIVENDNHELFRRNRRDIIKIPNSLKFPHRDKTQTPNCDRMQTPDCDEIQTPNCDEIQTPDCDEIQTPDCDEIQTPESNNDCTHQLRERDKINKPIRFRED